MKLSTALTKLHAGEIIPYRKGDGGLTGRGSMTILDILPDRLIVRIENGNKRTLTQKDWDLVEDHADDLKDSGTLRQFLPARNVTYILSIRGHLNK